MFRWYYHKDFINFVVYVAVDHLENKLNKNVNIINNNVINKIRLY